MTEHDDQLYLTHIQDVAARIERTATARGRGALDDDENLRDATLYRLQTLAESTQKLSAAFKEQYPKIPWKRVAGLRNRVVHGYLDVDLDIVWSIVSNDLPPLAQCVRLEIARRQTRSQRATPP